MKKPSVPFLKLTHFKLKKIFVLFLMMFISHYTFLSNASEYPADYSIKSQCAQNGPIRICRALQVAYNLAVVDIEYDGFLVSKSSKLFLWIQVNYLNGSKRLTLPLSMNFHSKWGARITGGCLVGQLGGCALSGTAEMRDFLLWAQQNNGILNQLDLNFAFVNEKGEWDNNNRAFGSYHVTFPQY